MKLALDTNAYTDIVRGVPERMAVMQRVGQVFLPAIVLGELKAGFRLGSQRSRNEQVLEQFIHLHRVEIVSVDEQTAIQYGFIAEQLKRQGTPIPTNDLWIAAIVLQHGLVLCTSDDHFRKVPYLPVC